MNILQRAPRECLFECNQENRVLSSFSAFVRSQMVAYRCCCCCCCRYCITQQADKQAGGQVRNSLDTIVN